MAEKVVRYYEPRKASVFVVFEDKTLIDWVRLHKLVEFDVPKYITY